MASPARSTADVQDEIERLEQSITRTLQEIDESFSNCQIIVSSKILPQIDRYAESSRDVWEHARLWLNFFEGALAPAAPVVGRRAQAAREARSRQQAKTEAQPQSESESVSTTPDYTVYPPHSTRDDDQEDNATNRQRIEDISLSSSRLSPGFLYSSPMGSIPSTPTPRHNNRNASRQEPGANVAPPASIQWPDNARTTPTRSAHHFNSATVERGSSTPTITQKDRPMSLSNYTQAEPVPPTTPTGDRHRLQQSPAPVRRNLSGGFLEFNVEEDHQDVITPPSTLHFSVPESKLATTPRSVVAKSLVDRIQMKDGLVIPQPIFVNEDEAEDAVVIESYARQSLEDSGIGGSKKRSRDGDAPDQEENMTGARSQSWASLTDQQRNKERLLKSPRKMASLQDFFAPPSKSIANKTASAARQEEDEEYEDGDGSRSPSRDLISQIQAQAEPVEEDPLLAALATPPETRKAIMDRKARDSLLPQRHAPSSISSSSSAASLLSKVSAPFMSAPLAARPSIGVTSRSFAPPAATTARQEPILTTAPIGLTTNNSRNAIDTTFMNSFNSAFAATSNRRQTMATPATQARGNVQTERQGLSTRNSMGSGFKSLLTPAPFTTPGGASGNSRLSLLNNSRRTHYPTQPSPATQAAASAVASAAAGSSAILSSHVTERVDLAQQSRPSAIGGFSFGAGMSTAGARIPSTPVVSTASLLAQEEEHASQTFTTGSDGYTNHPDSDYSSRGFLTPFANRNPPPAPRLGYHSDTMMTQSSLGLNHDGFGGYESEDRTRMTLASSSSGDAASVRTVGTITQQHGATSLAASASAGQPGPSSVAGRRRIEEEGEYDDDEGEEEDDDDDVTGSIMRSPCPPGKTFYGSKTDLKSVAQAAASARTNSSHSGGSSLFRRQ